MPNPFDAASANWANIYGASHKALGTANAPMYDPNPMRGWIDVSGPQQQQNPLNSLMALGLPQSQGDGSGGGDVDYSQGGQLWSNPPQPMGRNDFPGTDADYERYLQSMPTLQNIPHRLREMFTPGRMAGEAVAFGVTKIPVIGQGLGLANLISRMVGGPTIQKFIDSLISGPRGVQQMTPEQIAENQRALGMATHAPTSLLGEGESDLSYDAAQNYTREWTPEDQIAQEAGIVYGGLY